jgi:Putative Flp pilus-assembly TadE/G-like
MPSLTRQRGQIMPLVGVALTLLTGVAGFAVDVGYHQYQQRLQQTATDSAALAGAQELLSGNYTGAARYDAAMNGFTDNAGAQGCSPNSPVGTVCVEVHNPPQPGDALSSDANAVEVDVIAYHSTFFEHVFNINNLPIKTKAVAVLKSQAGDGCIYTLDPSKTANFNGTAGGGTITAPDCGLVLNGGGNFNNTTVNVASVSCAAACSNGTFTGGKPQTTAPAGDPCPQITSCAYLAKNPPSCGVAQTPPRPDILGFVTVPSGCYNGFTYHNGSNNPNLNVSLCGLYVITNTADISSTGKGALPISIHETPGCSGVTFYVTGNGAINFRNANITLNAPANNDYSQYAAGEQNVLFYQDPADTNTANLQSATCLSCTSSISGLMYFPSSNVNYTKTGTNLSGSGALIVSYDLNCNGCLANAFPAPAQGLSERHVAVLGE